MSKQKQTIREQLHSPTLPFSPKRGLKVNELLEKMGHLGFQGRNLGRAFTIYQKMLKEPCTIFMGLAGAMTAGGMRQILCFLMENHLIDVLVSTGANLFHDAYETLGWQHYQIPLTLNDEQLREEYLDRVYDVVCDEISFRDLEKILWNDFADTLESEKPYTTREFLSRLGEFLDQRKAAEGILTTAYRHQIPIYCPAFADSSLGIAFHDGFLRKGFHLNLDFIRDIWETGEMVRIAKEVGVFYIGGGTPKNFINQAAVVPSVRLDQNFGHKFAIQLTTDTPQWGGLSGCTFEEAKSWGKVDEHAHFVTVHVDATIALPLLAQSLCEIVPEEVKGDMPRYTYSEKEVQVQYVPRA